MSEVKRYTFKGAAGEYVYANDFDRVTAERDAALGREKEYQRQLGERWKDIDTLKTSLEAAENRAQTLHEVISRIKAERDAMRNEVGQVKGEYDRAVNKIDALQALLTAADERADVQSSALLEVEAACDLAMSAMDDDERGANFVQIISAIKAKAALKPADGTDYRKSCEAAHKALSMENQRIVAPGQFKCLACGDIHQGSGNLPCPKMSPAC